MKKVEFRQEIYSEESVKQALKAYGELAAVSLSSSSKYWIVTFWACKYDEAQTIQEFENYLIGLENC